MENIQLTGLTQSALDVFTTLSRYALADEHLDLQRLHANTKRLNDTIGFEDVASAIIDLQERRLVEAFTKHGLKSQPQGAEVSDPYDAYRPTAKGLKLHGVINDLAGHKALLHLNDDALMLACVYGMSQAKPAIQVTEGNLVSWPWNSEADGVRPFEEHGADFVVNRLIDLESLELLEPVGEEWRVTPEGLRTLQAAGIMGKLASLEAVCILSKLLFNRLRASMKGITVQELRQAIQDLTKPASTASARVTIKTMTVFRAACMVSRAGNLATLHKLTENCQGWPCMWNDATPEEVAQEVLTLTQLGLVKDGQVRSDDLNSVTLFSAVTDKGWNLYMKMNEVTYPFADFTFHDLEPELEYETALAGIQKYGSGDGTAPLTSEIRPMLEAVATAASDYDRDACTKMIEALEGLLKRASRVFYIDPSYSVKAEASKALDACLARLNNLPRTHEEIQALKENWMADGCWDIEDTEGFEAHREELLAFRREYTAKASQQAKERAADGAAAIAKQYGVPASYAALVYEVRQSRPYIQERAENIVRHLLGNAGLEPYQDWGADISSFVEDLGDFCANVAEEKVLLRLGKALAGQQEGGTIFVPDSLPAFPDQPED